MTKQLDSGMLQFTPKGAYYEGKDKQFDKVFEMWSQLFNHDRTLFALTTILAGTRFSKGMMNHMLLSNPVGNGIGTDLIPYGINDPHFEKNVILYNLRKENMSAALRNLLILAGCDKNAKSVNNSRTRKVILEYLFGRENNDLDSMAINFKSKMAQLVRHALGKQDLYKLVHLQDVNVFNKFIRPYNQYAFPVVCHLFNVKYQHTAGSVTAHFPLIDRYWGLKEAAQAQDVTTFRILMKGMPHLTVMGFRNKYKLPIEVSEIHDTSKKSDKQQIQMESAAKRSGAKKVNVNYERQELYDLWKAVYHKVATGDVSNLGEVFSAIEKVEPKTKINVGPTVVIIDSSRSMVGSDERPLHPFLTSLCLVSTLENVKDVIYAGGKTVEANGVNLKVPSGQTCLWKALIEASKLEPQTIIVVSDGYENTVQGAFAHIYEHLKKNGKKFDLLHINPVFSAGAKQGSVRMLAKDLEPLPISDYKFFETEFIFNRMLENTEAVKRLLAGKYLKLIEGGNSK
jgi:hypothetical protein